jgi:hypothetical protein
MHEPTVIQLLDLSETSKDILHTISRFWHFTFFAGFSRHMTPYLSMAVSKFARCCIFYISHIVSNCLLTIGTNGLLGSVIPIPIFCFYTQNLWKMHRIRSFHDATLLQSTENTVLMPCGTAATCLETNVSLTSRNRQGGGTVISIFSKSLQCNNYDSHSFPLLPHTITCLKQYFSQGSGSVTLLETLGD